MVLLMGELLLVQRGTLGRIKESLLRNLMLLPLMELELRRICSLMCAPDGMLQERILWQVRYPLTGVILKITNIYNLNIHH